MTVFKGLTRILAFVGKELVEVVRRPGALASLILGPFIVMAIFGAGYSGYRRPLDTVVVVPPESGLPTDVEAYGEISGAGLEVTEVTTDEASADQRLAERTVDVVLVAPGDVEERFRAGDPVWLACRRYHVFDRESGQREVRTVMSTLRMRLFFTISVPVVTP
jgi:ABC-2 type transport system permease protein